VFNKLFKDSDEGVDVKSSYDFKVVELFIKSFKDILILGPLIKLACSINELRSSINSTL
jgi:hypothetical protein